MIGLRFSRTALAVAACASGLALAGPARAADDDADPVMTVKIFNNSPDYNIYPVLSTGTADVDKWLQAAQKIPKAKLAANPFPKRNEFRLYLAPTGDGIPPGGSLELTLPLLSQLVPTDKIDPKKTDQFVDWWGGGRVEIFSAPAKDHKPPVQLTEAINKRPRQSVVNPIAKTPLPICLKGCVGPLKIYKDPDGLGHDMPSQLTEYTFGAIDDKKDPMRINPNNVDYDVSYVDAAFMPVAMEPFNNEQVGYVGMITSIDDFNAAMEKFVAPRSQFVGWPQFVDRQGREILKIPSPINVLARQPSPDPTDLTPKPWKPINKLAAQYRECLPASNKDPRCAKIRNIKEMFDANYENYVNKYVDLGCDKSKKPVPMSENLMIGHLYGWTPFNEYCAANKNLLENTPVYKDDMYKKYLQVKEQFDQLQYLKDGWFDPYALLIHGKDYINAPNVYAYSVDDAVGNMQVDGNGIILAVGGQRGLPNGDPATPPIHIAFGYDPKAEAKYVKYGICKKVPDKAVNPSFASFDVSINNIKNCDLTLLDNKGRLYTFQITEQPPFPKAAKYTPETHAVVDCSPTKDAAAKATCEQNAFGYTVVKGNEVNNYVSFPAAVQPAKKLVRVNFGYGPDDKVKYTQFGVCSKTPNKPVDPKDTGFNLPFGKIEGCDISLKDNKGRLYLFQITKQPPFPATPRLTPATHAVIDCSGNTNAAAKNACAGAFGYTTGSGDQATSAVIFPAPNQSEP